MGLFGKKKEKEEDYDDDELELEDSLQDRKLTRKINKDLNPENKKKRVEPPKPWGKRERLTVLIVMVATILISGSLYLSSTPNLQFTIHNLQSKVMKIQLPNFDFASFNVFKESTIIIEKTE